jgi:Cu-Zn family superoxide dismutase
MRLTHLAFALPLALVPIAAAQEMGTMETGFATLKDAKGAETGSALFKPGPKGLLVRIEVGGLTPGWHGMHLHEKGDCTDAAAGFKASGSHAGHGDGIAHGLLNPTGPEFGDMPSLYAGADGNAKAEVFLAGATLDSLFDADGTALIVHAAEDDQTSQPIGNAGARVACGVIEKAQ